MTPDGVPIIDYAPGLKGLFLIVGLCGQGFMMGPGIAKNVTSILLNNKPIIPQEANHCFRYDRDFYAAKTEALK